MKTTHLFWALLLPVIASSCGIANTGSDSDSPAPQELTALDGLQGSMQVKDTITVGEPVELRFTLINHADTAQQFLKWATPFEPLVSKYLDIVDADGAQVDYRGAMAKRAMPPSADSYIKLGAKDSLIADIDLLQGYAITKPSTYTIVYVGEGMSGITVRDTVSFVYR